MPVLYLVHAIISGKYWYNIIHWCLLQIVRTSNVRIVHVIAYCIPVYVLAFGFWLVSVRATDSPQGPASLSLCCLLRGGSGRSLHNAPPPSVCLAATVPAPGRRYSTSISPCLSLGYDCTPYAPATPALRPWRRGSIYCNGRVGNMKRIIRMGAL